MTKRIVVTGALGHIGSQLIRDLPVMAPGAHIVMVDNLLTQRYCSLFDLPAEGSFTFLEADVLSADLPTIFAGADVVVHLAAITDAANSFKNREQVEEVNLVGTQKVVEACLLTNAALVFPSTTSVYGTQAAIVDESCSNEDLKPQSPYAQSKLQAEQLIAATTGLRAITCRLGTIFGVSPGMRFHTAINKFCWQAVMQQPITVWRTALDQNRPYLELGDAVAALGFIIERELYDGRIYNVVTANASVRQIVDIIRGHVPDLTVQFVDTEIMNQLSYHVSSARFAEKGFTPSGRLDEGIQQTLNVLRAAHQHAAAPTARAAG